jgi:hypothetical protein
MKIELNWLIGQRIKDLGKQDYTWFFSFDDANITTESTWRLVTEEGIKASSADHGHKFGLRAPLDVIAESRKIIGQHAIRQYNLNRSTGDLSLHFDSDCELQFLNLSSGYESWHIVHGSQEIICMGGGKLRELENK